MTETELSQLFDLATGRLRELLDARVVLTMVPHGEDHLIVETASSEHGAQLAGLRLHRERSKAGRTFARQRRSGSTR